VLPPLLLLLLLLLPFLLALSGVFSAVSGHHLLAKGH